MCGGQSITMSELPQSDVIVSIPNLMAIFGVQAGTPAARPRPSYQKRNKP